jgi:hypothetical protein
MAIARVLRDLGLSAISEIRRTARSFTSRSPRIVAFLSEIVKYMVDLIVVKQHRAKTMFNIGAFVTRLSRGFSHASVYELLLYVQKGCAVCQRHNILVPPGKVLGVLICLFGGKTSWAAVCPVFRAVNIFSSNS